MNGIEPPTVLKPPETATGIRRLNLVVARNCGDIGQRVTRRNKSDGLACVTRVKVKRVPQQFAILDRRSEEFAEFITALGTHAKRSTCLETNHSVAGSIAE